MNKKLTLPLLEHTGEKQRNTTETALRRSEALYRLIAENTHDLIALLDLQFRCLYVSPSHEPVLGYTAGELLGTDRSMLAHPEDESRLKNAFEEALAAEDCQRCEVRLRHKDGHWLSFESVYGRILGEGGEPHQVLVVSRDITDRKRAEQEIGKLAAFAQFNPNPVLEFAADGTLSYFNNAALEMARSLQHDHPQALLPKDTVATVRMCLATGQDRLHVRTSMKGRTISWSFFPIVGHQMVHCYAEDITESLNMEVQIRQGQKMESVGQLAAGVAHDFNNILTIIQGHAGLMLSDTGLDSLLADSARQISLAADRAANLTRQLLMFSRKQTMQPQLLDLNEVIANVAKMLRVLAGEQVSVRRNSAPHLPPIHADAGMLEQVLVNLVVNARDAMPKGGSLTLSTFAAEIDDAYVQHRSQARKGYFVGLTVHDTGHGMDTSTLEHIFEPFFTTKEVGKGTGLGLATVYGIIQQHQGWIEVESQPSHGTTFKIFLPASSQARTPREAGPPQKALGGDETILLVEDEVALREMVEEVLRKKGYTVLEAPSGVQALEVWARHKEEIDLLLTDMLMPGGVSGRELAERILAEQPDLKVIYSSGHSLDLVAPGLCLKEGSNYLQKPYHPEALAHVVRARLDNP